MRYRTSHERGFHKCLAELLKLRAEKRKTEIGFESQKRISEENTRKQQKHEMAKEHHKWEILLAEAKLDHQQALTSNIDEAAFSQRAEDSNKEFTHTMNSISMEKAKKAA